MADRLGQQLGNYRLVRLLGRGGYAEVYLGEHLHLGTHAAIKVLKANIASDDIEQFRDEARTLVRLDHPHIVKVLDFGIVDGVPFLVMNHAPRGSVRHKFPKGSRVPLASIVTYVNQVATALQYAHNQKLIHRDVKPENMLLEEKDEILLSDFGIAVVAHSTHSQRTEDVVGTPVYMAPEQFEGKPSPASDQYALGITVYEWLCGAHPFRGTFYELYTQHKSVSPPPLDNIQATTHLIRNVILRALEKNPKERFASVQEFASALEQAYQEKVNQQIQPKMQVPAAFTLLPHPATEKIQQAASASPSLGKLLKRYSGHSEAITGMVWSLDGTYIATTSLDGTMQIWNVANPSVLFKCSFEGNIHYYMKSLAWSPNGRLIAVFGSNGVIQIWDIDKGNQYAEYTCGQNNFGYREEIDNLLWSPNGRAIAFRSFYPYPFQNSIKVWSMDNIDNVLTYNAHHAQILSFAWSPDSKHIASTAQSVHIWDVSTGGRVFIFHDKSVWVNAVTWSPGGRYIASAGDDKTVQIWNTTTGEEVLTYRGHSRLLGGKVKLAAWSPHGQNIASASDKILQVWGVTTGETVFIYQGHSDKIRAMVWSPKRLRIASISGDKTVHVWDALTGGNTFIYTNHSGEVQDIAWSPDGTRIASCSQDKTVQVWQAV